MKKVEFEVTVHTFHIDFAGHVSNIVYLQWMEIGRTRLLEEAGMPIQDLKAAGTVPVLAGTEITYRKPLYLGERVRVEVWLSNLGGATTGIEVRFIDSEGELVASGSHRGVFCRSSHRQAQEDFSPQRAALRPFLEE